MRFRIKPTPDIVTEIKEFDKQALRELMRRAAIRMADGDADEHIERSVIWEGHSEEFSRWLVREVRASFEAFGFFEQPRSKLELAARASSRLAILTLLLLSAQVMMAERDSVWTLVFMGPVVLLSLLYGIGFLIAFARLVNRLLGKDEKEEGK